jgi:hypothetical protein
MYGKGRGVPQDNVRIDPRWATPNAAEIRRHAAELAALAPDVILAHGAGAVGALLQATRNLERIPRHRSQFDCGGC